MGPEICYREFYLYLMLDIVASYRHLQFHGKLMTQTQENGEKPHFGPDLGLFGPNAGRKNFL